MLLLIGLAWAIPGVVTNLLAGYAPYADGGNSFNWRTYPLIGAWQFLRHVRPPVGTVDSQAVDIVWLLHSRTTHNASIFVMGALVLAAGILVYGAIHLYRAQTRLPRTFGAAEK